MRGLALLCSCACTTTALAQVAISGHVRTEANSPVAGAEITIASLPMRVVTDASGAFRIAGLTPGVVTLRVRKLGFVSLIDSVVLERGKDQELEYHLGEATNVLDTVRTVAHGQEYRSPGLRGFEERRLSGHSGQFISEAELRRNDNSKMSAIVLSRIGGVTLSQDRKFGNTLISSRKRCAGLAFGSIKGANRQCDPCWVTTYLDGALVYQYSPDMPTGVPYDMDRMEISDLAGVEYYAATGVGPPQFNNTGAGCGTLVLWTRER